MPARMVTIPVAGGTLAPARWIEGILPGDVRLPYRVDGAAWLADLGGDSWASGTVTIAPDGTNDTTASAVTIIGGVASVALTGGNVGTDYAVILSLVTVAGVTLEFPVRLLCRSPTGATTTTVAGLVPAVALPLEVIGGVVSVANPWTAGVPTDPTGLVAGAAWNDNGSWAWVGPNGP